MNREYHRYKGVNIYRCEAPEKGPWRHGGRWVVQSYHGPTGIAWADAECAHYNTLAEAREAITDHHRLYGHNTGRERAAR